MLKKVTLFLIGVIFFLKAGEIKKLEVRDLYTDPAFSSRDFYQKNFQWRPGANQLTYVECKDTVAYLLGINIPLNTVDTLLKSMELRGERIKADAFKNYRWFPEGRKLLIQAGNSFFIIDPVKKTCNKLLEEKSSISYVQISPGGKYISYIKNHNIFAVDIAKNRSLQLTKEGNDSVLYGELDWVYPEELEIKSGYVWSPDEKYIAFLKMDERKVGKFPIVYADSIYPQIYFEYYPKAGTTNPSVSVGIIKLGSGKIRWINIPWVDLEYIARIDWGSETELYIQALNRSQNVLRLYRYDIKKNKLKKIIEEKDPYWLNIRDLYYFFKKDDKILWYSEQSGYAHFYLYSSNGKFIKQITQGKWEVTSLYGVDENNGVIFFGGTRDSYLERHIYAVNIRTGEIKRIDRKPGVNRAVFSSTFRYYLCINSKLDEPLNASILTDSGKPVLKVYKNEHWDREKYGMPDYQFIKIKSDNGDTLCGLMLYPYNFDPEKRYPVLIYVYGGPHAQVVQNRFINGWHLLLTQRGYIVFSLDNRGSAGRGKDWERKIYLQFGKYELADQLKGVEYLKSLSYVDTNRIGIWGWSFGGYMTLMALTKAPTIFKMGIAVAPVTDWRFYDTIYTERYMGLPKYNKDGYYTSSPINFVENLRSKLLIVHGLADDNVHFQNTYAFINKLINLNKHFKILVYPGKKHGIRGKDARIHLFEEMTKFVEQNL